MLAHHPITGKEIRILQSDASLSKERKTLMYIKENTSVKPVWDTVSDSISTSADFRIILNMIPLTEIKRISMESKLILVSKTLVDSIGVEAFRQAKIQNLICLEEMEQMYPHLGGAWDGSVEDAVYLLAALLRYRYVAGLNCESKRGVQREMNPPQKLWWITQMYKTDKPKRRRELELTLKMNKESNRIDRIILLNEEILGLGDEKVEEICIGHRITYADVMKFICDKQCPDDVIIAFANADIAIDDKTWRNLWSISLENVFLALLRYDVPSGGDVKDATLFGPRADSQDTWVVRAIDVKTRGINTWESCNIPFGKAGCDNAIAVEMLRRKFLLVNPAVSLKTWHFHTSGVRGYNPKMLLINLFLCIYIQQVYMIFYLY